MRYGNARAALEPLRERLRAGRGRTTRVLKYGGSRGAGERAALAEDETDEWTGKLFNGYRQLGPRRPRAALFTRDLRVRLFEGTCSISRGNRPPRRHQS